MKFTLCLLQLVRYADWKKPCGMAFVVRSGMVLPHHAKKPNCFTTCYQRPIFHRQLFMSVQLFSPMMFLPFFTGLLNESLNRLLTKKRWTVGATKWEQGRVNPEL